MTAARRLLSLLLALAAVAGVGAGGAHAAGIGLSDGRPVLFQSPHLRDLNFQYVRLVLPWDAARRPGDWDEWLRQASVQGWPVLIAPTAAGAAPTAATYEAALRELLDRYPAIDSVEGWNEPNHGGQPTAGSPALAAAYFEAARRACGGRCTAVAGNLLDAASMGGYLNAYRAALTTEPAVWGVHNYYDSTYFQSSGVMQTLAAARGDVWITETGGLVSFSPNGPGTGLPADEHRAADGLRWLFQLTASNPRITRMYLYGLWQQPWNAFDSALLRVDNTEREGMAVVREHVGPRAKTPEGATAEEAKANGTIVVGKDEATRGPGAPGNPWAGDDGSAARSAAAHGSSGPSPVLRLVGKRAEMHRATRRVAITVRCAIADCTGRLTVNAGRWSYARNVQLKSGATRTIHVRVPPRAALRVTRRGGQRAGAALCSGHASTCSRVPLVRR